MKSLNLIHCSESLALLVVIATSGCGASSNANGDQRASQATGGAASSSGGSTADRGGNQTKGGTGADGTVGTVGQQCNTRLCRNQSTGCTRLRLRTQLAAEPNLHGYASLRSHTREHSGNLSRSGPPLRHGPRGAAVLQRVCGVDLRYVGNDGDQSARLPDWRLF